MRIGLGIAKSIKEIKIGEAAVKLLQYADDTTFFLDGTEESIRAVFGE